jgi:inner membrane protein
LDTLTHALSGALFARLVAARRPRSNFPALESEGSHHGRFAAFWDGRPGAPAPWQAVVVGFVAAAFPDIDAVVQLAGEVAYLRHHRGITHSLVMAPLWALLLSGLLALCFAVTRRQKAGWKSLYPLVLGALLLHIGGDWITQFGTLLLAPLSDRRFGLGAMFIIDLVFSGLLLAGLVLAALLPTRRWPAAAGLAATVLWVGVAWSGKQQAIAVAEQQAKAQGWKVEQLVVMPRPASPFNWTVSVYDGSRYHIAHVNTRRSEPLVASADDNFIRRFSAPFQPASQATWQSTPRFGDPATTPAWVAEAWQHEAFAFYRWFALTPALYKVEERRAADGQAERCAFFRDLRFEFPGREEAPFRYGLCLRGDGAAKVYKLEGGVSMPV